MDVEPTPQALAATITNGMYKFAGYGSVLLIADLLVPDLYGSMWPMFYTVIILTLVGMIADLVIVPRLGNVPSLTVGFVGLVLMIWAVPQLWGGNQVTLLRAAVLALCIIPLEYALHKYILRSI